MEYSACEEYKRKARPGGMRPKKILTLFIAFLYILKY